jgi:pimeloyl-ACP methyl ester carboxylesterase
LRLDDASSQDAPMTRFEIPEPRYATADDGVQIAYQVFGHGRRDIVFLPGNATQLDVNWEHPRIASFLERLATLGRVILVDRRGVGLSDRFEPNALPPIEVLISDLKAVLESVRSQDTVLIGADEGAHTAVLFAATHPERVRRLVLWAPRPSFIATPEHPWGGERDEWEEWFAWAADHWGSRESIINDMHELAPGWLEDESAIAYGAKVQRAAVSPRAAVALFRISIELDVSDVLPTVRTPTLVAHRRNDAYIPVEAGRAVAELLPNATFAEIEGDGHFAYAGDTGAVFDLLHTFLEGEAAKIDRSRRLATVVFTDIVGSTERSAIAGDKAWTEILRSHHEAIRRELDSYGGQEMSTAGDGFFALFDGPAAAVRSAAAAVQAVRELGLEIRVGVHTGEIEVSAADVSGIAVHIGARIGALAGPSEVLVSSTVKDLVTGSGLAFEDIGERALKGVPEPWHLFRVVG